jgi:LysM repeat protein
MIKIIFLAVVSWLDFAPRLDSLRMETVNGKAFIIHQVSEKETLYSISRRYGSPITGILEVNPTADGGLEIGQLLKIPYVPKPKAVLSSLIHKVQPKETLFSISKLYNVSVEEIKAWNYLTENSLTTGQELRVKKPASFVESKATEAAKGTHVVASGETMFSISRDFRISVDQIKAWNKMQATDLKVGQVILVSGPALAETKSTETKLVETKTTEVKKTTEVAQVPISTQNTVATNRVEPTIRISENVVGTDEVREGGLAELIEGTEGNRKYLAMHRTAKPGTILKVRNELNNREVFVRVVGTLPPTGINDKLVIKISKSAYDRLGAIDPKFRVEVTYYK